MTSAILIIRLTHTGVLSDGRPNLSPILISDADTGFSLQTRKVAVYVPPGGFIELPLTSNTLFSLVQGNIAGFVRGGLLQQDLFLRLRNVGDRGEISLAVTNPNIRRSSNLLQFVINQAESSGYIPGESVRLVGLSGNYATLSGTFTIVNVAKATDLVGPNVLHYLVSVGSDGPDIPAIQLAGVGVSLPEGKVTLEFAGSGNAGGLGTDSIAYVGGSAHIVGGLDPTYVTLIPQEDASIPWGSLFIDRVTSKLVFKTTMGDLVPIGAGGAGVDAFNGRTGVVVSELGDYSASLITNDADPPGPVGGTLKTALESLGMSVNAVASTASTAQDAADAAQDAADAAQDAADAAQVTASAAQVTASTAQDAVDALETVVATKLSDAPQDGKAYVRQDGQWVELGDFSMGTFSGFGESIVVEPTPVIQIDGSEGFTKDHEVISSGTGVGSTTNAVLTASTGVGLYSYCIIQSNDLAVYHPGQSITAKFTAIWSAPASNGFQMAGLFGVVSAVAVGYSGTTFGMLRRIPGVRGIYRLTLTTGTGGAETLTITLNGIQYVIAVPGVQSASTLAQTIASSSVWNGTPWRPSGAENVSPTANDSVVTFLQNVPGTAPGTYSLQSTGTATGNFTTVAAGSPNDDTTDFIAQSSWNGDKLNGSGPSGIILDPTKLNVWRIVLPYLGAGPIKLFLEDQDGGWVLCNTIKYPNTATVPSQGIPSYKIAWAAASLGSTTNISVGGASGEAQIDGKPRPRHISWSRSFNGYSATATETVPLAFRVRSEFGGVTCGREVRPVFMMGYSGTSNRIVIMRLYINPTLTGSYTWSYHDQNNSALEYTRPTGVTISGTPIASVVFGSSVAQVDLTALAIRAQPGDVIAFSLQTDTSAATVSGTCNGTE